jgi:hypothetical protein
VSVLDGLPWAREDSLRLAFGVEQALAPLERAMRRLQVLVALLALSAACCAPASDQPAPGTSSSLGILDVPIGQAHSQFEGAATETAFAGFVVIGAPLASGALSDTFYDYSVQIDASNKSIMAVSARRVFASMPDCQMHFQTVASAVKSKYPLDSESTVGPASLEATSGPLTINVLCGLVSGGKHPALSLSIANKTLAAAAYKNAQRRGEN